MLTCGKVTSWFKAVESKKKVPIQKSVSFGFLFRSQMKNLTYNKNNSAINNFYIKKKIELFYEQITDFTQSICFLQELCRIVVSAIYYNLESPNDELLFETCNLENEVCLFSIF